MTALVSQLLEINRLDVGRYEIDKKMTPVDPICADIIQQNRLKADSKKISIDYTVYSTEHVQAMVDATALSQIIDNLVSNAVKYSPFETAITCGLEVTNSGGSLPDLIIMDKKIRFYVRDQGPGIDPSEHPRVFQKFAKTSNAPTDGESSSGLGLSIAKKLARAMGGDLGFISKPGEGSTFYLELPHKPMGN
jgi:signal transduction histidine kinase